MLALPHGLAALRAGAGKGPYPDLVGIRLRAAEHAIGIFHFYRERVLWLNLVQLPAVLAEDRHAGVEALSAVLAGCDDLVSARIARKPEEIDHFYTFSPRMSRTTGSYCGIFYCTYGITCYLSIVLMTRVYPEKILLIAISSRNMTLKLHE